MEGKNKNYELSLVFNIWNNGTGDRVEISEGVDGLGLIEIRFRDNNNNISNTISFILESAKVLIKGLDLFIENYNKIKGE